LKKISTIDRLIVALDVPDQTQALKLLDRLFWQVSFVKVGLELFASGQGIALIEELAGQGYRVFADFKFHDIPQTVYRAVRNLNDIGVDFLTVHCYPGVMEAAVDAAEDISILGVTVLTSMSDDDLVRSGYSGGVIQTVQNRAELAYSCGCAGVVASGYEARAIRDRFGSDFIIVTPGVRMDESSSDDQKRIVSVEKALQMGSDYLVVGREIRDAWCPGIVVHKMQSKIRAALAS